MRIQRTFLSKAGRILKLTKVRRAKVEEVDLKLPPKPMSQRVAEEMAKKEAEKPPKKKVGPTGLLSRFPIVFCFC